MLLDPFSVASSPSVFSPKDLKQSKREKRLISVVYKNHPTIQ